MNCPVTPGSHRGLFLVGTGMNGIWVYLLLLLILAVAAITDCRSRRIPNWLTLPAMVGGMVYHTAASGFQGFLFSVEGALLGLALLILFYLAGGMGAGDVKLMGAVGSLLGPKGVFFAFLYTAIAGGVLAVALLLWKGHLAGMFRRYGTILKTFLITRQILHVPPGEKKDLPALCYGVVIGVGTAVYVIKQMTFSESFFSF